MTLKEAREILGLELTATRREIKAAYRRAARRWHPDHAPPGAEEEYRVRMQNINAAYSRVRLFLDQYRYRLEEEASRDEYEDWWLQRFGTSGVWGAPPPNPDRDED